MKGFTVSNCFCLVCVIFVSIFMLQIFVQIESVGGRCAVAAAAGTVYIFLFCFGSEIECVCR